MAVKPGWEGRFFEDFEVGDISQIWEKNDLLKLFFILKHHDNS